MKEADWFYIALIMVTVLIFYKEIRQMILWLIRKGK